jgi:hypothetical protein
VLKKKIWANFQRIIELFTKKIVKKLLKIWTWDPGSGIRDPEKTYSGSRIQGSKSTRSRIPDPDPQHCQDVYVFFYKKMFTQLSESYGIDRGSVIRENSSRIRIKGVKKHRIPDPHPQHWHKDIYELSARKPLQQKKKSQKTENHFVRQNTTWPPGAEYT